MSELMQARMHKFPVSGEINRTVSDPKGVMAKIAQKYKGEELSVDYLDGVSMEFKNWRFNLRPSNTEPVIRLNIEVRQDKDLLKAKTEEILGLIANMV